VTGGVLDTVEVSGKRLELRTGAVPWLRRVVAFYPESARTFSVTARWLRDTDAAARQLGLGLELVDLGGDPALWEPVFDRVRRRGIDAAVIIESPSYWNGRARLADLALNYPLPLLL